MKKPNSQGAAGATKAVGYARVSTPDQAEKGLSLPAQVSAIRRYAQDHGLVLVGEYVERGITGTDDNRPEFRRMLGEIFRPSSEVGSIIVTHGSRFMRNATKARIHKEALRKRGIRVVAMQQEVSDDPNGRFAEGVFELIDQLESETNGVRTRAGMSENARQGFFNGSKAPFGFRVEKVTTPAGSKNKLVVDAGEADLVREVFKQYLSGSGAKATAIGLNRRGLRYRSQRWSRDLVLKVISDTCADGRYYRGRQDSRGKRLRPEDQWILIAVDRIVDDERFRTTELRLRRPALSERFCREKRDFKGVLSSSCPRAAQSLRIASDSVAGGTRTFARSAWTPHSVNASQREWTGDSASSRTNERSES